MSRLFPHTPYAEDQPLSHTILTTHVLHRAIPTGAALGLIIYPSTLLARSVLRSFRGPSGIITNAATATATAMGTGAGAAVPPAATSISSIPTTLSRAPPTPRTLLSTSGRTVLSTTLLLAIYLPFYHMANRDEIEWQDRAWRILENKSQVKVDEWSLAGMAVGVGGLIAFDSRRRQGRGGMMAPAGAGAAGGMVGRASVVRRVLRVAGAAGLGSLAACTAYCVWTYGINAKAADASGSASAGAVVVVEKIVETPVEVVEGIVGEASKS